MNVSGLIINEIGMAPLMTSLLHAVVAPLAAAVYPGEIVCHALDHHHSFVVDYSALNRRKDVGGWWSAWVS